jgi:hypothetical protein
MATKNLKFWGTGYYADDTENVASIVATLNGTVIYTGTVPSKNITDFNRAATAQQVLFSVDVDENMVGDFPMAVQCTGGDSVDVQQVFMLDVLPASPIADCRSNVALDGVPQSRGPNADAFPVDGTWSYQIPNGSTLTHTLTIYNYDSNSLAWAVKVGQLNSTPPA